MSNQINREKRDVRKAVARADVQNGKIKEITWSNGENSIADIDATLENIHKLLSRKNYGDLEIYVSVRDCRAILWIGDRTEFDFKLTPEEKESLEQLKNTVIYEDNQGAINWSAQYYPSLESLEKIVKLLKLGD